MGWMVSLLLFKHCRKYLTGEYGSPFRLTHLTFLSRGCTQLPSLVFETTYYNVVDSPVGCIPITRVDVAKDQLTEEWTKGSYSGFVTMEKAIYQGGKKFYDPEAMHGMPVGVQIVGKRWEEEKVLAMMRVVEEALGVDRGFGPGAWDKSRKVAA